MKKIINFLFLLGLLSACQTDCWQNPNFKIKNECSDSIEFIAVHSYFGFRKIAPNEYFEFLGNGIQCSDVDSEVSNIDPKEILKHNVTINFSDGSCLVYNLYNTKQTRSPLVLDNYNWDGNLTFEYTITEDDHQTAIEECGM